MPHQGASLQASQANGNYIPLEELPAATTAINGRPLPGQIFGPSSSSGFIAPEPAVVTKPARKKGNFPQAASQDDLGRRLEKFQFQQRNVPLPGLQSMQSQAHLAQPKLEQTLAVQTWQNQSEAGSETVPWKQVQPEVEIPGLAMEAFPAGSESAANIQQDRMPASSFGPGLSNTATAGGGQAAVAGVQDSHLAGMRGDVHDAMAKFIGNLRATAPSDPGSSALVNDSAAQLTLSQPSPSSQPEAIPIALLEHNTGGIEERTTTADASLPAVALVDVSRSEAGAVASLSEGLAVQRMFESETGKKRPLPPTDVEHDALYKKPKAATVSSLQPPALLPFMEDKEASQGVSRLDCGQAIHITIQQ